MKSAGLSRLLSSDPTKNAISATITRKDSEYRGVVRREDDVQPRDQRASSSCSPPGTTRVIVEPDALRDEPGRGDVSVKRERGFG